MPAIALNNRAPSYELPDLHGNLFRSQDHIGKKNLVLVFNRGFV